MEIQTWESIYLGLIRINKIMASECICIGSCSPLVSISAEVHSHDTICDQNDITHGYAIGYSCLSLSNLHSVDLLCQRNPLL